MDYHTSKNTILAAFHYYQARGMGEPSNRSNGVNELATGEADDLDECVSLDYDGLVELTAYVHAHRPVVYEEIYVKGIRKAGSWKDGCIVNLEGTRRGSASRSW